MLRFPVGVATFTTAVTLLTVSVSVAYAPFHARYGEGSFGDWSTGARIHDVSSGSPWSWLLVPLGAAVLLASLHLMSLLARVHGTWTSRWLHAADPYEFGANDDPPGRSQPS